MRDHGDILFTLKLIPKVVSDYEYLLNSQIFVWALIDFDTIVLQIINVSSIHVLALLVNTLEISMCGAIVINSTLQ